MLEGYLDCSKCKNDLTKKNQFMVHHGEVLCPSCCRSKDPDAAEVIEFVRWKGHYKLVNYIRR